jgi:hypothetical protein
MTRRLAQIRSKFWRHNPDVLRCTILSVQSENSELMLPKFCPDPNWVSHHKHVISITIGWVYDITFSIDVGLRNEVKNKLMSHLTLCSLRNG